MNALTSFTKRARNQINFRLFNNKLCVLGPNANKQRLHQQRLHQLPIFVLPMLATATKEPRHDTKYVDTQVFVDRILSSELCFNSYSSSRCSTKPFDALSLLAVLGASIAATTSIVECTELMPTSSSSTSSSSSSSSSSTAVPSYVVAAATLLQHHSTQGRHNFNLTNIYRTRVMR